MKPDRSPLKFATGQCLGMRLFFRTLLPLFLFFPWVAAFSCMPTAFETLYLSRLVDFPSNEVTAVIADKKGNVFVGTEDQGLVVLHPIKGSPDHMAWFVPDEHRQFLKDAIHSLHIDSDNTLWIGTTAGLFRVPISTLLSKSLSGSVCQADDGLKDNVCLSLAQNAGVSEFWVGTTRGLVNSSSGFRRYTDEEGLPSNLVQSLVFDYDNNLWIGTSLGLARRSGFSIQRVQLPSEAKEVNHWVNGLGISSPVGTSGTGDPREKFLANAGETFDAILRGLEARDASHPVRFESPEALKLVISCFIKEQKRLLQASTLSPLYVATNQGLYTIPSGTEQGELVRNGWFTALAVNRIGNCYAGDTDLSVVSAESRPGLDISYDVRGLIRNALLDLVATAAEKLEKAANEGFPASVSEELKEMTKKSSEDLSIWIDKLLAGKKISSMCFNPVGQLWVGVKGGGLFRFNPVVINHDAFSYALRYYNELGLRENPDHVPAQGFAITTESTKDAPPQVLDGIATCRKVNPQSKDFWVGRWSDLSLKEVRSLGLYLGQYSHPACITHFAALVFHDPWVIIPKGKL